MSYAAIVDPSSKGFVPDFVVMQLGKRSDRDLSSEYGISAHHLRRERVRRHIPAFSAAATGPYPAEMISLLGQVTDREISRRFNISALSVFHLRTKLGIPRLRKHPNSTKEICRDAQRGAGNPDEIPPQKSIQSSGIGAPRQNQDFMLPRLPENAIALLGKISDDQLAIHLGIPVTEVKKSKLLLGIKNDSRIDMLIAEGSLLPLLGTMPDSELAKKFGIGSLILTWKRMELGIAPYKAKWSSEIIALIGETTDVELAQKLGVEADTVSRKRRSFGIKPKARIWTKENVALLGTVNDPEVARIIGKGVTVAAVKNKRQKLGIEACRIPTKALSGPRANAELWTPSVLGMLGVMSDYALAKLSGIERSAITIMRNKKGIPPYSNKGRAWNWTKEHLSLLGALSDVDVALKIGKGIHRSTVAAKRKELGIAALKT